MLFLLLLISFTYEVYDSLSYFQVYSRVGSVAVGKLSLNLNCFNKESMSVFGPQLLLAIKNLLPFTQCISLTVDYLNTASLSPKKDYETNR